MKNLKENPTLEEVRKRERQHLAFASGIFLILSILSCFLTSFSADMEKYYVTQSKTLVNLFLLPLTWLVFGWTIMQTLGMLGVAKQGKSKYSKPIHVASIVIVLLYAVVIVPTLVESIQSMIQFLHYKQNPALYPAGYQYVYNIPVFLSEILTPIANVVDKQPSIFAIPSIIFWSSRQIYQDS